MMPLPFPIKITLTPLGAALLVILAVVACRRESEVWAVR